MQKHVIVYFRMNADSRARLGGDDNWRKTFANDFAATYPSAKVKLVDLPKTGKDEIFLRLTALGNMSMMVNNFFGFAAQSGLHIFNPKIYDLEGLEMEMKRIDKEIGLIKRMSMAAKRT